MKDLKVICKNIRLLPKYAHKTDVAFDLYASGEFVIVVGDEKKEIKSDFFSIQSGQRILVKTGIHIELPKGHFGNIRSRSGLALNEGIITLGGIIDSGYRGEIGVILYNTSKESVDIKKYERIAQMIIQPFEQVNIIQVEELSNADRAHNGFGSSGKK